jgi:hypothetical protein
MEVGERGCSGELDDDEDDDDVDGGVVECMTGSVYADGDDGVVACGTGGGWGCCACGCRVAFGGSR